MKKLFRMFLLVTVSLLSVLIAIGCNKKTETSMDDNDVKLIPQETYVMKVGAVSASTTPNVRSLYDVFEKRVEELTNGGIDVIIYDNGTLGEEPVMAEQTQMGTIQMSLIGSNLSNIYPRIEIMNLPYIFKTFEEADNILRTSFAEKIMNGLPEVGLYGLGLLENGFRQTTTNSKKISSLSDFKGLKIRTPNSAGQINLFKALGANPTPVAFSELYSALNSGVVDGQENGYNTIVSQCYYEIQDYLAVTNHMYGWFCCVLNKSWYDLLPLEYQNAIKIAFEETQKYEFELSRDEELKNKQICMENGMIITEPNLSELEQACSIVYDEFRKNNPEYVDLLDDLLASKQ